MRYLFGFLCVCALGVMPLVGCTDPLPERDSCEGVECDDGNECTEDVCDPANGTCGNTPADDGAICEAGACQSGDCQPITSIFPCTEAGIREAIAEGGGPHAFACNGGTTVTTGMVIIIDNDVILDGLGELTVEGTADHRVFSVSAGVSAELRRLTVTNGAFYDTGSGIMNFGTLTLTNCTVSDSGILNESSLALTNSAVSRGDISSTGTLTLTNGTVADGGGINADGGTVTLVNSTVSGNTSRLFGGGIWCNGAVTLTLVDSTISGNTAETGGGVSFQSGTATLVNSTVSGNHATINVGGIGNNDGTMTLVNSTVSGNTATYEGGGVGSGGTLRLVNSTVSGNTAGGPGSAVYTIYDGSVVETTATVIDGECGQLGGFDVTWVSNGHNIESPGDTCGFDQPTDQVNVSAEDLRLGALEDNGGPTKTHALGAGSVAIDVIPEAECLDADGEPLTEDQRGEPRPGGAMCDVGAFEVQP